MALLDWESFARETANLGMFTTLTGDISADGAGPYNYGRYFTRNTSQASEVSRLNAWSASQTVFIQWHYFIVFPNTQGRIHLYDGSTSQIYVEIPATNVPVIKRGDGTVLATSSIPLRTGVWEFLQFRVTIANSGGTAELRINGKVAATFTGDTQNTANASCNGWMYREDPSGNARRIANIVVYSDAGNAPNNWTPETRIWDTLPTGAGGTTQWTPSAGANWQCVDEQPSNGDTDYVSAASAPLTDTYSCPAEATAGSIIYAVAVHATARKDDAGTNEVDGVLRSAGADYANGAPAGLTASYARYRWLWETDPATGVAWTVAGANAAQPGIRRTT
jgi:hypothetical protein